MVHVYTNGDEPVPGYRLVKFLGRGGFGEVWKATGPGGTQHALKIISLDGSQGLKEFRAIRLVKNVRHANLVPINAFWLKDEGGKLLDDGSAAAQADTGSKHDTDAVPAELIMAMGLGDKNLWDRLRECQNQGLPGIPAEELLDYMEGSARAIDHLNMPRHELGSGPVAIQHCDIKPQNIMIVADTAQVCDFGLARVLGDARTTAASLSAAYAAPEFISESKPSKWTDQYSLAISYYELRTGALPFDTAGGQWKIIKDKVDGKLDLSKLQDQEREVIGRATHIEPIKRYPTTLEMVKALRRAYEGKLTDSGKAPASRSGPLIVQKDVEIVPGYRLLRMLGRGSYGEVWEAAAPGGRRVALKIIQHLEAAEGKQEFKALQLIKNVDHEHLMELHAYWLLDKQGEIIPDELHNQPNAPVASILVIAGKLASKNLAQRLEECKEQGVGGIPVEELLRYIRQAAQAIDHLNVAQHKLDDKVVSIQHRDIKPENIMLAGHTVKVADFGLAKVVEGTSAVIHGDSAGLTLAYAAPEMFENRVTTWTDQYSLALSYYHLRTGTLPFRKGSSTHDIIRAHMEGRLDLSRLPPPEMEVIRRATALTPEDRYPTCSDMAVALQEAAGAQPMESVMLPGSRLSTGTGTTPGRSSGTVSDPKRSGVRPRPAIAATAQEDPFQTMQNVPRGLRSDAVETAEAGLLDTDRPPSDLTSVPPPWVTKESARQKSKKVQIRIAITVTIGLVIGAVGLIVYTLWPKPETPPGPPGGGPGPGVQEQIAKLISEDRYREAHDKAAELPSAERGKAQSEVVDKWQARVEKLRDAGDFEKALVIAESGSFANDKKKELLESIRDVWAGNAKKDPDPERVRRQADLILRALPNDALANKLRLEAEAAISTRGRAEKLKDLIARAAKETDPARKLDLAEQIISHDRKRFEGFLYKAQTQFAQADPADPDAGGADKTAQLARNLLAGQANAELDKLEGAIRQHQTRITVVGRAAELQQLITKTVAAEKQPDFQKLLEQAEEAAQKLKGEKGDLAKAFYAECLIEAKGPSLTDEERKKAEAAAEEAKVPEHPGYEKYVRGLVRQAKKNPQEAARELVLAYQVSPLSAPLKTSYRKKRAADILKQAALAQRQDGEFIKRPLQVLDKKDKASAGTLDKLDQLYDWLAVLKQLAPTEPLSPELQINLALAGFYESDPKARQAAMQVAADLLKEPEKLGPLVYTLALHRAKALEQNVETHAEAIRSYVELLDLVKNRVGGRVAFGDVYAGVVVPIDTLEAVKPAKPELKQQLARFHADVAGLLSNESLNALPEKMRKTRPQLVLDRFDRAASLDKRPEYLVGRGYARCELPDADLNAARKDGEDANNAAGHGLVGHIDLLRARGENDPKKRVPLLTDAAESLRKALEQTQPTDPARPVLLTTRSAAFLELANANKESNLEFNLGQAERLATEALTYVKRPNPEYAISARGNALEDLAWLAKQGDKWEAAVASFTRAVDAQPDRAQHRLDRGRCRFKWVAEGGADRSTLILAKTDLEDALERSPTPAQEAEARFWLGGVLELQEDFAGAEKSLRLAVEIALAHKLGDWTDFQLGWAKLALNDAARDPRAAKRLSEARSRAQELRNLSLQDRESLEIIQEAYKWEAHYALATSELARAETAANELDKLGNKVLAAVYRGRVFEARSQGKEALEAYSSGLPGEPSQFEFKHVDLVQGRGNFLMDYRWADLHSFKRDEILEQADRAVALAFGQEVGALCDHLERRLNEIRQLRAKRDNARKDLTAKKQELAKAEEALAKTPGPAQEAIRDAKKREAADAAAEVDVLENTLKRVEPNSLALAEFLQRAEQKPGKPRAADDKTILERIDADIAIGIRHDAALKTRITKQLKDLRELAPQGSGGVEPVDASQDRSLLAKARATAGAARRHLALSPTDTKKKETYTAAELLKKREALHTAAIELLREAIKLAPSEPAGVVWRMSFADSLAELYQRYKESDPEWSKKRRLEAEDALDLAAKLVGDNAAFQEAIANVRKKFK